MSLQECRQKHTHREYLAWLAWIEKQWNKPSRSDHYLMQIAIEIRQILYSFSKGKKSPLGWNKFKIPFARKKRPLSEEEKKAKAKTEAQQSKSRWKAFLGVR